MRIVRACVFPSGGGRNCGRVRSREDRETWQTGISLIRAECCRVQVGRVERLQDQRVQREEVADEAPTVEVDVDGVAAGMQIPKMKFGEFETAKGESKTAKGERKKTENRKSNTAKGE